MAKEFAPAFTRATHLAALSNLVVETAGSNSLRKIFDAQDVSTKIIFQPNTPLLRRDHIGLCTQAARISHLQCIGLLAGTHCLFDHLGPYGRYASSAPTLAAALIRARDTLHFYESASALNFDVSSDEVKIYYQCADQNLTGWRHLADIYLCLLCRLVEHFLGASWTPERIETSYRSGPWQQTLEQRFGVPIEFDMPAVAIFLPKSSLNTPNLKPTSASSAGMVAQLLRYGRGLPTTFSEASSEIIRQRLLAEKNDIYGAAAKFGITERTFQRHLYEDRNTYRQLLTNCTATRATDLLANTTIINIEIASMLGYSTEAHFIRAFKRWMGVTPGKYRRSLHGPRPIFS